MHRSMLSSSVQPAMHKQKEQLVAALPTLFADALSTPGVSERKQQQALRWLTTVVANNWLKCVTTNKYYILVTEAEFYSAIADSDNWVYDSDMPDAKLLDLRKRFGSVRIPIYTKQSVPSDAMSEVEILLHFFLLGDIDFCDPTRVSMDDARKQERDWVARLQKQAQKDLAKADPRQVTQDYMRLGNIVVPVSMPDDAGAPEDIPDAEQFEVFGCVSKRAYQEEGSLMHHCVASYFQNSSYILSVRPYKSIARYATVEVRQSSVEHTIVQLKGHSNTTSHFSPDFKIALEKFIKCIPINRWVEFGEMRSRAKVDINTISVKEGTRRKNAKNQYEIFLNGQWYEQGSNSAISAVVNNTSNFVLSNTWPNPLGCVTTLTTDLERQLVELRTTLALVQSTTYSIPQLKRWFKSIVRLHS